MKVLVTGVAGFIGSHLASTLLDRGVAVAGIDCFTDYYPRAIKQSNLDVVLGRPGFRFLEDVDPGRRSLVAARRRDARVSPGRSGWRQAQLGHGFPDLHRQQHRSHAAPARGVGGRPIERFVYASSSSVYGDARRYPTEDDVAASVLAVRRDEARRRAPDACSTSRNFGLPTVALRYFTVYGPRQRPTWRSTSSVCGARRRTDSGFRRRQADARLHLRGDAVAANAGAWNAASRGRAYNVGGGSRVASTTCST